MLCGKYVTTLQGRGESDQEVIWACYVLSTKSAAVLKARGGAAARLVVSDGVLHTTGKQREPHYV